MRNHLNNIQGAVLGQAIGDAMGSQTEFNKGKVAATLKPTWGYDYPAFSDDTQNMLAIAEALATVRPSLPGSLGYSQVTEELNELMKEVGRNFVRWAQGDVRWGANDRSPGGTCMGGTRMLATKGVEHWSYTGATNSGKGNGGAMRSSVVGCYFWQSPLAAFQVGALTSVPTHNNVESLLASGTVAYLVASAIAGEAFSRSVLNVIELCRRYKEILLQYQDCNDQEPGFPVARFGQAFIAGRAGITPKSFHSFNGNDFKGVEAVAAAIHANTLHNNYHDIILSLANGTGDSDTTAAIGGAIAGARFGASMIDKKWKWQVEKSSYLQDVALRIWKLSTQDTTTPSQAHP